MDEKIWLTWEGNTLIWGDKDGFVWDQVFIVKQAYKIMDGGTSAPPPEVFTKLREEMKEEDVKKFIRIVCEVNGRMYSETRYKTVEKNITIDDIKRTFDRFINVTMGDI